MTEITEEQVRFWVRDELRKILDKGLMYSAEVKPQPQAKPEAIPTLQALMVNFPDDLKDLIVAEEQNGAWFIKPKKWLGSDLFKKISSVIRNLGGKYVSEPKNNHWEVPK